MSDNLRDRIAKVIEPGDWRVRESGVLPLDHPGRDAVVRASRGRAQAIIDEFGLTVRGDGCGYHEIYGSYDTRFEN